MGPKDPSAPNLDNFMARMFRFLLLSVFLVPVSATQETLVPLKNHDFGVVKQGQKLVHVFPIRNAGEAPMRIDRVESSLPGMSARFQPIIPSGGEARITVEWNTADVAGVQEATILVQTSDPNQLNITLNLKAVVKPPIEFLPYPAVFFSAYQDEAPEKRVRIVSNGEGSLHIERIESPESHYEVALDTVEPGRIYDLRVKVRPGVALGRYIEQIVLTTDQPENHRLEVGANLFVKPDFYAFPEIIDFGSFSLETLDRQPQLLALLTQTTILTNRSGPLEVQSVTSDLPFLRFSRSPDSGKDTQFRLDVMPIRERMQPGKITGHLRVLTNDPGHPELTIPVQGEVK